MVVVPTLTRYPEKPPLGSRSRKGMKNSETQITMLIIRVTQNGLSVLILRIFVRGEITY
jgi:hypothetical protein